MPGDEQAYSVVNRSGVAASAVLWRYSADASVRSATSLGPAGRMPASRGRSSPGGPDPLLCRGAPGSRRPVGSACGEPTCRIPGGGYAMGERALCDGVPIDGTRSPRNLSWDHRRRTAEPRLSPYLSPYLGRPRRPTAVRFAHLNQRGTCGSLCSESRMRYQSPLPSLPRDGQSPGKEPQPPQVGSEHVSV